MKSFTYQKAFFETSNRIQNKKNLQTLQKVSKLEKFFQIFEYKVRILKKFSFCEIFLFLMKIKKYIKKCIVFEFDCSLFNMHSFFLNNSKKIEKTFLWKLISLA